MTAHLIYLLYRLSQWLLSPLLIAYVVFRCSKDARWRTGLAERFGRLGPIKQQTPGEAVWLHAVSVGEVISAIPFIGELRRRMPGVRVFVSVGTVAGRELAQRRLQGLAERVFYVPFDYVFAVRAVLRRVRPHVLVVMETEIWPNLWREAGKSGAKVLVINGRISGKAFARYRSIAWALRPVLALPERILVQTDIARERFASLGAPPGNMAHGGNLKYDFGAQDNAAPPDLAEWIDRAQAANIWIAASTMPPRLPSDCDEDSAVLDAFQVLAREFPGLLLILVPRRPERFDSAAELLTKRRIAFVRRSALKALNSPVKLPGVLLLDTIGELGSLFRFAQAVFMGGTLVDRGGHNILEPAFFDKPVVSGPHLENFPDIAAAFRAGNALVEISEPAELAAAVGGLLRDPDRARSFGERGGRIARQSAGATQLAVTETLALLDRAIPRSCPNLARRLALTPLSWVWRAGTAAHRGLARKRSLPRPVVSIGGLAMGGTGKTPFAIFAAKLLLDAGREPVFLTRGYGRRSGEGTIVAAAGADIDAARTGDEAQILIGSGLGPVGIGSDRAAAALQVLARHDSAATVFLLDDGFQHWRLKRDADVVLIDALDPFAGGVFPLGRLRQQFSALRRATVIVVTRCRAERNYVGLRLELRRWNSDAPIFLARTRPVAWVDVASGERLALAAVSGQRCIAFCGLGNPASFWQSLEDAGVPVEARVAFPDHHRYTGEDLRMLAAKASSHHAQVVLTTAKDVANLPAPLMPDVRLLTLEIELEVENSGHLQSLLLY